MRSRPVSHVAALSLAIVAVAACGGANEEVAATPVVDAHVAIVGSAPFIENIGAIGIVTGRPGHFAALGAPAAARIGQVFVAVGQRVGVGQQLVALDPTVFQSAASSANAALVAAERAHERAQRLAAQGIVPRKDVEQAASDLAKARAEAANAARAAQLAMIRAPIAGVVTRVNAMLGATADPAQALVEVADPSVVDIILNVTPTQAGQIRPGAKVQLSAGQQATGEPLGVGTVTDVSAVIDSATRGVAVRVQAPTTRRPLRIGETVFGQVATATRSAAVVVPERALVPEGDGFKVFVVDANGVAHSREVNVGGHRDTMAEITSGLAAGERIVTYGAYGVDDSVKVRVVPASGVSPRVQP